MFTPTAAPARALTKSSPYNGPRGPPGPHETNPTAASSRNTGPRTSSRDPPNAGGVAQRAAGGRGGGGRPQVLGVAAEGEVVGAGTRRAVARHTGAVVGEEAVVCRGEVRGKLEQVGVVRKPVDPAAAEAASQLADVGRREARPLEGQHDVGGSLPQASGEPGGEGASEEGVPATAPLLAAAHFASQRGKRRRERQAAPVVAAVERRDQHDPQPPEWAGRHTST